MAFRKEPNCGGKCKPRNGLQGAAGSRTPAIPNKQTPRGHTQRGHITHTGQLRTRQAPSRAEHTAHLLLGAGTESEQTVRPGCGGQLRTEAESSAGNLHDIRKSILNCAVTAPGRSNPGREGSLPDSQLAAVVGERQEGDLTQSI